MSFNSGFPPKDLGDAGHVHDASQPSTHGAASSQPSTHGAPSDVPIPDGKFEKSQSSFQTAGEALKSFGRTITSLKEKGTTIASKHFEEFTMSVKGLFDRTFGLNKGSLEMDMTSGKKESHVEMYMASGKKESHVERLIREGKVEVDYQGHLVSKEPSYAKYVRPTEAEDFEDDIEILVDEKQVIKGGGGYKFSVSTSDGDGGNRKTERVNQRVVNYVKIDDNGNVIPVIAKEKVSGGPPKPSVKLDADEEDIIPRLTASALEAELKAESEKVILPGDALKSMFEGISEDGRLEALKRLNPQERLDLQSMIANVKQGREIPISKTYIESLKAKLSDTSTQRSDSSLSSSVRKGAENILDGRISSKKLEKRLAEGLNTLAEEANQPAPIPKIVVRRATNMQEEVKKLSDEISDVQRYFDMGGRQKPKGLRAAETKINIDAANRNIAQFNVTDSQLKEAWKGLVSQEIREKFATCVVMIGKHPEQAQLFKEQAMALIALEEKATGEKATSLRELLGQQAPPSESQSEEIKKAEAEEKPVEEGPPDTERELFGKLTEEFTSLHEDELDKLLQETIMLNEPKELPPGAMKATYEIVEKKKAELQPATEFKEVKTSSAPKKGEPLSEAEEKALDEIMKELDSFINE